jgi:hypothetical protein
MKIVVWENDAKSGFDLFSGDIFYDFLKPLQILDGDGWNPELRFIEGKGQVVLTTNSDWPLPMTGGCKSRKTHPSKAHT